MELYVLLVIRNSRANLGNRVNVTSFQIMKNLIHVFHDETWLLSESYNSTKSLSSERVRKKKARPKM